MKLTYQYRTGTSVMHRLDPVSKFVWMFSVSFLAFGTFRLLDQLVVAVIVFFFAFVLARLSPAEIWRATWIVALACVSYLVVQSLLLRPQGNNLLFVLPGLQRPIYREVVEYAMAVAIRIYIVFLVALVFIRTTHPRDFAVGLVQILRLPYKIPYALFIALRAIPTLEEEAKNIMAAHRVRGIGERGGLRRRFENAKRLTIPLLIRSLRDATTTALSMEARGFGAFPTRTYVQQVRMTRAGKALAIGCLVVVAVWYALVIAGVVKLQYSIT
ncbi:MAG: energy-coupling factor transporter transmembrane protein EcfT [Chloroflexota bacterium]|nr:energy-coupling factor transporter transmembrane protein EcfT [Chloroflexota bacterium]